MTKVELISIMSAVIAAGEGAASVMIDHREIVEEAIGLYDEAVKQVLHVIPEDEIVPQVPNKPPIKMRVIPPEVEGGFTVGEIDRAVEMGKEKKK